MNGDYILGINRNYGLPALLPNFRTFPTMSANVLLPLSYPTYTPEVRPARPSWPGDHGVSPCLARGCALQHTRIHQMP